MQSNSHNLCYKNCTETKKENSYIDVKVKTFSLYIYIRRPLTKFTPFSSLINVTLSSKKLTHPLYEPNIKKCYPMLNEAMSCSQSCFKLARTFKWRERGGRESS